MAKVTITPLPIGLATGTAVNSRLQALANAFENTLSRNGATPNQMEADLDLDSNDIINVDTLRARRLFLSGIEVFPGGSGGGGGGSGGFVTPQDFGAPEEGYYPASQYIQTAIDRLAERELTGVVWLDREYALEQPLVLRKGVILAGNLNVNRRDFPATFNGVRLYPHDSAPQGMTLIQIGTAGNMGDNPNGTYMAGLALDGRLANGTHLLGCIGLYIRDTSDVRFQDGYLGGFDRTNNTGFGAIIEGSGEGNCFGTSFHNSIIHNCQHGIFYTGLGTTDMRHSNNLYVGVTRALTLGWDDRGGSLVQQGGAGMQIVNDHFTYTGMPTAGWFIRSGGQGGSLMVANTYFDQHGTAEPIRLGNAKAKFLGCHFLMAAAQNAQGLIRVMTGGTQQVIVQGCTVDLMGSTLKSLVFYSAISTTPTGGIVTGNMVYGTGSAWVGFTTNSAGLIPEQTTSSFVNSMNSRCP